MKTTTEEALAAVNDQIADGGLEVKEVFSEPVPGTNTVWIKLRCKSNKHFPDAPIVRDESFNAFAGEPIPRETPERGETYEQRTKM